MKLILYENKSDNNVVNKVINRLDVIEHAVLKDSTSILSPSFIINFKKSINNEIVPNLLKCNYIYCYATKRYYFVNDIELDNASRLIFKCSVDVLYTYRNEIKRLKTYVERQENKYNKYIIDNEYPIRCERKLELVNVGSVGSEISYILTVLG